MRRSRPTSSLTLRASALSQLEFGVPLALPVFFIAERSTQEFQNHWQSQWHTIPESSVDKALVHFFWTKLLMRSPNIARGKMFIGGLVLLVAVRFGLAPQKSDENKSRPPRIEVSGDWGGGSHEDVRAVLDSCAKNLLRYSPERQLGTILVRPREGVPITLDQKGPHGEHQVLLSARGSYWCQYAYQFSHESVPHPEQLRSAEAGPEFVVRGGAVRNLIPVHDATAGNRLEGESAVSELARFRPQLRSICRRAAGPARIVGCRRTGRCRKWFREHEETLVRQNGLTTDSKLVAVYLLPLSKTSRRVGKRSPGSILARTMPKSISAIIFVGGNNASPSGIVHSSPRSSVCSAWNNRSRPALSTLAATRSADALDDTEAERASLPRRG